MGRNPNHQEPYRYYRNYSDSPLYYALNTKTNEVRTGFADSDYWINIGYNGCGDKLIAQDSSPQYGGLVELRPEECPLVVKNIPRNF